MVKFYETTSEKYNELLAKNLLDQEGGLESDALYFLQDVGQIKKGEDNYTNLPAVSKDSGAVDSAVTNVNFTGKGFVVEKDPDNPGRVNVSMPFNLAKMTASNYNSTGGNTNPSVSDISKNTTDGTANTYQTRYVALSGDESYLVGTDWTTTAERSVLNKDVTIISYTTADYFWLVDDKSTKFRITLTKGDGTNVVETTSVITGAGTYTTTNCELSISNSNWSEDFMGFKAKATIKINVAGMLGGAGRFGIKITHLNGGSEYSKEQKNLFYDDNPAAGSVESGAISLNSASLPTTDSGYKWLSGVKYLNSNTKVDITLTNVNGVFDKSFESSVGTITTNCTSDVSYTASDVASAAGITLSEAKNTTNASSLTKSGIAVTSSKYFTSIQFTKVTCSNGWNTNTMNTASSTSLDIPIDTYAAASTSLAEQFQDENYRLKSDLSTKWDSTLALGSSDLQVGKGTWLFPSDASTSQVFIRNFAPSNNSTTATSNFTFTLSGTGLTEANLSSGSFGLEISLDGSNWFTFAKDKEDVLTNGSGIREYKDTAKLSGTSGTLRGSFTAGMNTSAITGKGGNISGYGIYARITIKGSGIEVNSISVAMV